MDTKVYYINEDDAKIIKKAAEYIKDGKTVVFPTETVYGLGANALDENACKKIFQAKGRPQDNPLIIHVAHKDISKYAKNIPDIARTLIDNFWPGPLTIILEKQDIIPMSITGGLETVGIRMPESNIARKLIDEANLPIAAPSANISGKPSPTTIEHCIRDLSGRVDMIIGGEITKCGIESTIVAIDGGFVTILRPGRITKEMMESVGISVKIDPSIGQTIKDVVPRAPGMKYKHYAPDSDMTIIIGENKRVVDYINSESEKFSKKGKKVGVISTSENLNSYKNSIVLDIGSMRNMEEVASRLFDVLREFDKIGVDYIFAEGFNEDGVGLAIMNRLKKAAGHKIIRL